MSAGVPLLDPAAAARGDQAAVDAGDSWAGLMERAAGHLARGVVDVGGHGYGLRVTLAVGKGNNGGDGWAAARRLLAFGAQPRIVAVHGVDVEMSEEAASNRDRYLRSGGLASGPEGMADALARCDVAVDCLLGTGATGAPRGPIGEAVSALLRARDRGVRVVACDVPTGVQACDGQVPGDAVAADMTVTLGGWKRGLLLHPGARHVGRVVVGGLGRRYRPPDTGWWALTACGAAPPPLPRGADKLTRGRVLVVAGSRGMAGAAILCAAGALAAGAGLVTVAVPRSVQDLVAGALPPALTVGLDEDDQGAVAGAAAAGLADRAGQVDAVVAGPGMTHRSGVRQVTDALLTAASTLVLDADALNVYRSEGEALAAHAGALILTPQHRELARVAPDVDDGDEALRRRAHVAPELAERLDVTVVAKGPGTVVAAPDGRVWVNPTGGPALGAGGTGDVLAGAIAAASASADDPPVATARACWWAGLAGDLAGAAAADRSASSDVAAALPHALALTRELAERRPDWPFDPPGWHAGRQPPHRSAGLAGGTAAALGGHPGWARLPAPATRSGR